MRVETIVLLLLLLLVHGAYSLDRESKQGLHTVVKPTMQTWTWPDDVGYMPLEHALEANPSSEDRLNAWQPSDQDKGALKNNRPIIGILTRESP